MTSAYDVTDWYLPNPHQFKRGKLVFSKKPFASTSFKITYILEGLAIANQTWNEAVSAIVPETGADVVAQEFIRAGYGDYMIRDFYWCRDDDLPPHFRDFPQAKVKTGEEE